MNVVSRRGVATTLLALTMLVGWAAPASAHAIFVSMSPGDGSVVQQAPSQVVVTFNEPIQDIGTVLVVHSPSGGSVTSGSPVVLDNTVTQQLQPLSEPGTYSVAYRVTSTDGHPVSKELTFSFKNVSAVSSSAPATDAGNTSSSGSSASSWLVPAAVVVAVALIALATLLVLRRRRRSSAGERPDASRPDAAADADDDDDDEFS